MQLILADDYDKMSRLAEMCIRDSCTDDGSYGFKGVGTAMLEKLVSEGHQYDLCRCV